MIVSSDRQDHTLVAERFNDWREPLARRTFDLDTRQVTSTETIAYGPSQRVETFESPIVGTSVRTHLHVNNELVRSVTDVDADGDPETTVETVVFSPAGDPLELLVRWQTATERQYHTFDSSRRRLLRWSDEGDDGTIDSRASFTYQADETELRIDFEADDRWDATTRWILDDRGRPVEEHQSSDLVDATILTTWEGDHMVEQHMRAADGWEQVTTYRWDAWGRPVGKVLEESTGAATTRTRWRYFDCPDLE